MSLTLCTRLESVLRLTGSLDGWIGRVGYVEAEDSDKEPALGKLEQVVDECSVEAVTGNNASCLCFTILE